MPIWSAEIKELETLYLSSKGMFPDLDKEMEKLIDASDENMVLVYSRRCLEVIITDLCETELKRPRKTEPLQGIIDKLNREEKVPSHIVVSMHYLNSLSTFGAHPKDFDPEEVKPMLSNLIIILKWYFKFRKEKAEEGRSSRFQGPSSRLKDSGDGVQGAEEQLQGTGYKLQGVKNRKNPIVIISGILVVLIIAYILLDQFNFFRKDKFGDVRDQDGKISIAVMPFDNLTGDTTLNWFQRGISSLIINGLGNSSELAVRDDHTMFEVMESMNQVYTAGVSPSIAKEVAEKVKAETYISGSFQGQGDTYWVLVNLVNTRTGEVIRTDKVQGNLRSSGYLAMADSLCNEIKNWLEIKALEENADYDFREAYPESAEAYRYFVEGMNLILNEDYEAAIQSLKKALEIDSTFAFSSFYIAFALNYNMQYGQEAPWVRKAWANRQKLPYKYQSMLGIWYAINFTRSLPEITRYCRQFEESGIQSRLLWFDLGTTYVNYTEQYDKAVEAFDRVMELNVERGGNWKYDRFYAEYAYALHLIGQHEKEKEIFELGLKINPDNFWNIGYHSICNISQGDYIGAEKNIIKFRSIVREDYNWPESLIELYIGHAYLAGNDSIEAEKHYRKAYDLNDTDLTIIFYLGNVLINADININEGMALAQKGLALYPENGRSYWLLGRITYKQAKYEEALQLLRKGEGNYSSFNYILHKDLLLAEQAISNKNKLK